ncbi:hypothetical protein NJB18183_40270 [Mycobacterium montefiorense]|nr:hypothetical protein NJB18182_44370 [Mycobacterium montefiorense]GKU68881.1 hypothetical protein NJB18183_40270 [Mycobacterium montefiorense]
MASRIDLGQPDFHQPYQQPARRGFGQPKSLTEINQPELSGLGGDLVQGGGGAA